MKPKTLPRLAFQGGLTYMEVLIAIGLIALCIAPLMQSLHSSASRYLALKDENQAKYCATRTMERTMMEPYAALLQFAISTYSTNAATGTTSFSNPTAYSVLNPTDGCPPHRVYILRYQSKAPNPFATTSNEMLYVRTEVVNSSFVFETLVIDK